MNIIRGGLSPSIRRVMATVPVCVHLTLGRYVRNSARVPLNHHPIPQLSRRRRLSRSRRLHTVCHSFGEFGWLPLLLLLSSLLLSLLLSLLQHRGHRSPYCSVHCWHPSYRRILHAEQSHSIQRHHLFKAQGLGCRGLGLRI